MAKQMTNTDGAGRAGADTAARPTEDTGLPRGVVMVTIEVPVYIGEFTGHDGGSGHIDGHLGRPAAQACQRVLLAQHAVMRAVLLAQHAAMRTVADRVPMRTTTRIDCIRSVFQKIDDAIAGLRGSD